MAATPDVAARLCGEIQVAGGRRPVRLADLTDMGGVRQLADESGEVDVLVNNAGESWFGPTPDLDEATFGALFDGNVRSAFFLVAALAPGMARREGAASSACPAWRGPSA